MVQEFSIPSEASEFEIVRQLKFLSLMPRPARPSFRLHGSGLLTLSN